MSDIHPYERVEGPKWSAPWIQMLLAIVGVALSAAPLMYPEIGTWPALIRWSIVIGPFVPLLLWIVVKLYQTMKAAFIRSVKYNDVMDSYEKVSSSLNTERKTSHDLRESITKLEIDLQHLQGLSTRLFNLSSLLYRYNVINIMMEDNKAVLVLKKLRKDNLIIGNDFVVINGLNGEWLGRFEYIRTTNYGHLIREIHIHNALWWGKMHEDAVAQRRPRTNAIAILIPPEPDEQEEASA